MGLADGLLRGIGPRETNNVISSATTSATADLIVAAPSLPFDGNTWIKIRFGHTAWGQSTTGVINHVGLFDNGTLLGSLWNGAAWGSPEGQSGGKFCRRLKPSAGSHLFDVRSWVQSGTLTIAGGADPGSPANDLPNYLLITNDPF